MGLLVSANPVYIIPQSTPFALTAIASDPDGDLLTVQLTDFGWAPNSPVFEFEGNVTGGSAQALYGPTTGVILNLGDNDFTGDFHNFYFNGGLGGLGEADVAPVRTSVPEATSSITLLLIGCVGLFLAAKRSVLA